MKSIRHLGRFAAPLAGALLLSACANQYDLTLMPRDSGKLFTGHAEQHGDEAQVTISAGGREYTGTWVQSAPETTTYAAGYYGGWGGPWGGYGAPMQSDVSNGRAVAKALLQSADGSGLRCDFFGLQGGHGVGKCTDDHGLVYDVQIRLRKTP